MTLDIKRIETKIQFIEDNLSLLRELSASSESEFVSDRVKFFAAVHALQVSIEAMLDIFSHVIARRHLAVPANDRETLEIALKKGLTIKEHFVRYVEMNKFRNKVVHGYIDVDAKAVYTMLHRDLGDFELFFADVRKMIKDDPAPEGDKRHRNARK